jgi:hypothetical protein
LNLLKRVNLKAYFTKAVQQLQSFLTAETGMK